MRLGAARLAAWTVLVCLASAAKPVRETDRQILDQKTELQALRRQLAEGRRKVKELEGQSARQAESVAQIKENERLGKLVLERIDQAQESCGRLLEESRQELETARQGYEERQRILTLRVRRIWMRGRPDPGLAWLGQEDPEAFFRRRKAFQAIVEEDRRLLAQVREKGQILSRRVDEHEARKRDLAEVETAKSEELAALGQTRQGEERKLAALQDKAQAERSRIAQLEASQAAIETLLKSLEKHRLDEEKRYRDAQAAARKENEKRSRDRKARQEREKREADKEARERKAHPSEAPRKKAIPAPEPEPEPQDIVVVAPPPSLPQGNAPARAGMCWPIRGRILSRFGLQRNSVLGTTTRNLGVEIVASQGQPVACASGGKVAAILHLPGRGTTVVVEHPGGYFTLYGHLSKVLVREGASVSTGRQIALAGSEESNDGPKLYFELRKGLSALDPLEWLTR